MSDTKHQPAVGVPAENLEVIPSVITTQTERIEATGLSTYEMYLQFAAANFNNMNLEGSQWPGVKLRGASLTHVNLRGCDLSNSDLHYAFIGASDLSNANLSGAFLQFSQLQRSNLTNANLENADLRESSLYDTDMTNANLTGTLFEKATYSKDTKWPKGFDPVAAGAILEEVHPSYWLCLNT